MENIDAVLHLASNPAHPQDDVRAAEQLTEAAAKTGVRHLLFLSIIGVDRIPYPYYEAKLAAEQCIAAGAVPWTIVRAAQFHSFVDWLLYQTLRVPGLMLVPAGFSVQSVADTAVADRLLDAIRMGAVGRTKDFAGPEVLPADEVARLWRRARHVRRLLVPVPLRGAVARAFRQGANTAQLGDRAGATWAEWLRERYAAPLY